MTERSKPATDDLARLARAELLLDYIVKKVREQVPKKENVEA